jgi:hypothetical protein
VSHWERWHEDYADPSSSLSLRLAAVQQRLRDALDVAPAGPVRLLSVCAGQGHDVVGALQDHPRRADVGGRLVELDPANAATAREALADAALGLEVLEADAGTTDAFVGAVPADLVLLCGIFGNVPDADVERTARSAAQLCAPGATLLWTRHRRDPDLTPAIRRWFAESGFTEVAFDSPGPEGYAVGTGRLTGEPASLVPGQRLFTFG